ncbi:hypothetical protein ABZ312_09685 [Streptomyces sp. NPDC006207]
MARKPGPIAHHFTADELEELLRALRVATFFDHLDMTPRQQALAKRVDDLVHADMAGKLPEPPPLSGEAVLATAMRAAITCETAAVDLFDDGFEITGLSDDSLYVSDRAMTRGDLARFLRIPEDHIEDAR